MVEDSLYPPPYSRTLEQEESRDFEGEKSQTDSKIKRKSLGIKRLRLRRLAQGYTCSAVEEVNGSIAAGICHCDKRLIGQRMNKFTAEKAETRCAWSAERFDADALTVKMDA